MTFKKTCSICVIGMSVAACAGELSHPERFEVGQSAASTEDAGHAQDRHNSPTTGQGTHEQPATYDEAQQPDAGVSTCGSTIALLTARCANQGCHGADNPAAGLDLKSANLGARLRDVTASAACEGYALIDSKDRARSLLYLKVTDSPPCAPRMPIGTPLSDTEQDCLLDWLKQL